MSRLVDADTSQAGPSDAAAAARASEPAAKEGKKAKAASDAEAPVARRSARRKKQTTTVEVVKSTDRAKEFESETDAAERLKAEQAAASLEFETVQLQATIKLYAQMQREELGDSEFRVQDLSESEDEGDDEPATTSRRAKSGKQAPCSTPEMLKQCSEDDNSAILQHFATWLKETPVRIEDLYTPEERREHTQRNAVGDLHPDTTVNVRAKPTADAYIYPMYIGALNNLISGFGMASYLRRFGQYAQFQADVPVAFMLYSTVIKTYEHLTDSSINFTPASKNGNIERGPETSADAKCRVLLALPPANKTDCKLGVPCFRVFLVADAEEGINLATSFKIDKIAFLGYDMFTAGLTVQTVQGANVDELAKLRDEKPSKKKDADEGRNEVLTKAVADLKAAFADANQTTDTIKDAYAKDSATRLALPGAPRLKMFVATYMGLAASEMQGLDTSLQIVGRCFAELKRGGGFEGIDVTRHIVKPSKLKIQLLAYDGMVARLQQYSVLEERLAKPTKVAAPLYQTLKTTFSGDFLQTQSDGKSLGTVGSRKGSIAEILGFSQASAANFANKVEERREAQKAAADAGAALPAVPEDAEIANILGDVESGLKTRRAEAAKKAELAAEAAQNAERSESTLTVPTSEVDADGDAVIAEA
jgi:hypothetical protein